jgi:hypothetical protein
MSQKAPTPKLWGLGEQQRMILLDGLDKLSRSQGVTWSEINPLMQLLASLPEIPVTVIPAPTEPEQPEGSDASVNGTAQA